MNTEDFVTYEQALALKKLGFDWKVNHCYFDGLEELTDNYIHNSNYDNCNSSEYVECVCSAPTLAQAQKWLLKNKEYYVQPAWVIDKDFWVVDIQTKDEIIEVIIDDNPFFNSYEEALSAGITECLKLLEDK